MRRAVKERRIFRMHPLDLSPKTNPSHFKSYCGEHRKSETLFLTKDNNKKAMCTFTNKHEKDSGKRGRPRADKLTTLMVEGSSSRSKIRCNKCGRVFPREKSLQAHLRTHTGERPYPCDYPGCTKAFCQSGQLKTHQRLHTGEKPFVCNIAGCTSRFTHANRHCSTHPNAGLRRTELNLQQVATQLNQDPKHSPEKEWLERYIRRFKDRLNPRSDTSPLDMRKQSTARPRDFAKRKTISSTTTVSVTSTETIEMLPSPSPPREEYKKVFFTPLPRIPPHSSTSSRMSPVPFPVSPPNAHQSSVTLTPLTPRHPGSASSISSRSSSSSTSAYSSSSSSSSFSSSAVRDLSSFIHTPTNSSSYSYHISPDKPSFEPAPYCSAVITDHISHSPYYGQVLPPPPSIARPQTLTSVHAQREMKPSIIHHPIKREKDRYISALALIELSKG